MSNKYLQGYFQPKNPEKYVGSKLPIARSSWELHFMRNCDEHPSITRWASEPMRIPYQNPVYNKISVYVPDFLIEYVDSSNRKHVELLEIKPGSQTFMEQAKSKKDKIALAINAAKWEAASAFCKKNGIYFRVISEKDLFHNYKRKK